MTPPPPAPELDEELEEELELTAEDESVLLAEPLLELAAWVKEEDELAPSIKRVSMSSRQPAQSKAPR